MPRLNLLLQYLVYQPMLLDHRQTAELGRSNIDSIHTATPTADILDLQKRSLVSKSLT